MIRTRDPFTLAKWTGAIFISKEVGKGEFQLPVLDLNLTITFPELNMRSRGAAVNILFEALTLYYFLTSDGTPESGKWIAFSDLPDGRFYAQAFQGYTGAELSRHFKNNLSSFKAAARRCYGSEHPMGDAAFLFKLFPKVSLIVVGWCGDEEFPPNYQILFNASAPHHLPTDVFAIAGNVLTRNLLRAG